MKLQYIIHGLNLLFVGNLFAGTNFAERMIIPFLDEASQSNIVITADWAHQKRCPLEYTNLLSNTNLFSPAEKMLLTELPIIYGSVTPDLGPPGTVLVSQHKINGNQLALFRYINTGAQSEVTFGKIKFVKFRTKSGDGYNIKLIKSDVSIFNYIQIKDNIVDGLVVVYNGSHCETSMHFEHGMAVGKYYSWDLRNGDIVIEADFKEPYDWDKHLVHINL